MRPCWWSPGREGTGRMSPLLLALMLGVGCANPPDTLLQVRQGDRLSIQDFSGSVTVEAWNESAVRVRSDRREGDEIGISRHGQEIRVRALGRDGREERRLRVQVPAWLALEIVGRELDADVEGMTGDVEVRSGEGDLWIRDVAGSVVARALDGEVIIANASGRVEVFSGDDNVTLDGVSGDVLADVVDGDLEVAGVISGRVEASTIDGEILFQGTVAPNGECHLTTHSGDVTVLLDERANLDVVVTAYSGGLRSDFPIRLARYREGEEMRFTLGDGGARLVVEAFDGDVSLVRLEGGPAGRQDG